MNPIKCGTPGAKWKHHDGEMVQTNLIGDDEHGQEDWEVEFMCLRCGYRWWETFTLSELDRMNENDD